MSTLGKVIRAAIDVGSNSVLLVIAKQEPEGWKYLGETSEVTGLGAGTKTSGVLSEKGMTDTLAAVGRAYEIARKLGADEILAAATMACRIASNAGTFLARANAAGYPVFVLPGDQEAELGFLAVAEDPLFAEEPRLTVIDPGGHSTEIQTSERSNSHWQVLFRRCTPLGGLALREERLREERPTESDQQKASTEIDRIIGMRFNPGQSGVVVVIGAIGTNLVSIREKFTSWQPERVHGTKLTRDEVRVAFNTMCAMDDAERGRLIGIEKGRERTIHAGALILERALQALDATECVVSVRGWRHALLEHGRPSGS